MSRTYMYTPSFSSDGRSVILVLYKVELADYYYYSTITQTTQVRIFPARWYARGQRHRIVRWPRALWPHFINREATCKAFLFLQSQLGTWSMENFILQLFTDLEPLLSHIYVLSLEQYLLGDAVSYTCSEHITD
jgi:hypothetical protein